MKRAALYVRVSTDEQSCDMQERDLLRLAEQRGLEVAHVYRDEGWSGAKASRPAFDAMLRDAKRGRFSVLLCWKLDRLGRSLSNLLRLLEDLRTWNVGLVSYSESLDLDSPSGRLMFQLVSAFAEYEREIIRSRVKAGLRNARAKGKRPGRPRVAVDATEITRLRAEGLGWPDFRARPGEVSHCQGDSISFRHYGEGPDQLLTGLMTSADIFSVE